MAIKLNIEQRKLFDIPFEPFPKFKDPETSYIIDENRYRIIVGSDRVLLHIVYKGKSSSAFSLQFPMRKEVFFLSFPNYKSHDDSLLIDENTSRIIFGEDRIIVKKYT